jgi:quinolinate synthase
MATFKVTYGNTITGNQNTITTKADSLEAAIATEKGMVERLSKFRPGMKLVSVVKA